MMAHTPGPWQAYESITGFWDIETEDSMIRLAGVYPIENAKANATLMAAAPRLLEALDRMELGAYSAIEVTDGEWRYFCHYCEENAYNKNNIKHKEGCLVTEARAALAAARGEE